MCSKYKWPHSVIRLYSWHFLLFLGRVPIVLFESQRLWYLSLWRCWFPSLSWLLYMYWPDWKFDFDSLDKCLCMSVRELCDYRFKWRMFRLLRFGTRNWLHIKLSILYWSCFLLRLINSELRMPSRNLLWWIKKHLLSLFWHRHRMLWMHIWPCNFIRRLYSLHKPWSSLYRLWNVSLRMLLWLRHNWCF